MCLLFGVQIMAEGEGFEPPVPCGTTVFKTAAFDHSAIPPRSELSYLMEEIFQPHFHSRFGVPAVLA